MRWRIREADETVDFLLSSKAWEDRAIGVVVTF